MSSGVWNLATKPWHAVQEYNYEHYRAKHLLMSLWWTLRSRGIQPTHAQHAGGPADCASCTAPPSPVSTLRLTVKNVGFWPTFSLFAYVEQMFVCLIHRC